MSEDTGGTSYYDWVVKILAPLIIPVFLWGISLQVDLNDLQKDMEMCKEMKVKISKIEDSTRSNGLLLERVKIGLEHVKDSISQIESSIH